jgi:hypothetical protein
MRMHPLDVPRQYLANVLLRLRLDAADALQQQADHLSVTSMTRGWRQPAMRARRIRSRCARMSPARASAGPSRTRAAA